MSVKFDAEEKPFRVRIIGIGHPHRGAEGTCDPEDLVDPGKFPMARVRFDYGHNGAEGAFAAEHELERKTSGQIEDRERVGHG